MMFNVPPQLLHPLSAPLLLLWALPGPKCRTARRDWLGGGATHQWDPLQGLLAQAPARLGSVNSGRHVRIRIMYIGKVNKEKCTSIQLVLPRRSKPKTGSWCEAAPGHRGQQGRAKMLEALS
jgi:hypothetical protein